MALARAHTWNPGDVLRSADLNGEFNNILNNPISLISPSTGAINFNLQSHVSLIPGAITATSATSGQALVSNGSTAAVWGSIGGSAVTSGVISAGAMLFFSTAASPLLDTLAIGTSGQVLTVSTAGKPAWAPGAAAAFSVAFESSEITFTASTVVNVAHGLGGRPTMAQLSLRCVTSAANGYSTGDEWIVVGTLSETNAANQGASLAFDATNLSLLLSGAIGSHYDKINAGPFIPLSTVFKYVARAWR